MVPCTGISLLLGIEHLDAASHEICDRPVIRWPRSATAPATMVNDSLVRLLGSELRLDPDAIDRAA